ncbi:MULTISPECIES: hypothetical protein [Okeania]|nr:MULTISPECIES: hypothetical protein [Okeania]
MYGEVFYIEEARGKKEEGRTEFLFLGIFITPSPHHPISVRY